jgi:cytochrome c peroxidase
MGYHTMGFFWDGRAVTLREQSLKPIQDVLEMNETLPNVVAKLSANKTYRGQFTRVFGDGAIYFGQFQIRPSAIKQSAFY